MFSVLCSLGNIGPGEKVKVEIEYIMELRHDAEIEVYDSDECCT